MFFNYCISTNGLHRNMACEFSVCWKVCVHLFLEYNSAIHSGNNAKDNLLCSIDNEYHNFMVFPWEYFKENVPGM